MKIGDKLVILIGILFVASLYQQLWFSRGHADFVQITVDEQATKVVSLADEQILAVQGEVGISELEIHEGKIRFKHSPCANQICVHTGWLEKGGDFAACLPNRIAVEVMANDAFFDAINF